MEARSLVPSATTTTSVTPGPTSMVQSSPEGPCSGLNWFRTHAIWSGVIWVFEKTLAAVGTWKPKAAGLHDRIAASVEKMQRQAMEPPPLATDSAGGPVRLHD